MSSETTAAHTVKIKPVIMAVINTTTDSFYEDSRCLDLIAITHQVKKMLAEGAHIIDIGAESTRPGAKPVPANIQIKHLVPAIAAIRSQFDVPISIDTSDPQVMQAGLDAGANWINDIRALSQQGALNMAAKMQVKVCLVHMQGQPDTMQDCPTYPNDDVTTSVKSWLETRIDQCLNAGIKPHNIIIDPGFGFGKTAQHNWQLLNQLEVFAQMGYPLLVGLSRKSIFASLPGQTAIGDRLIASTTAAALAVTKGANIVRVHDIQATAYAINTAWAMMQQGGSDHVTT